jgi:hypothetical protein
MKCPTNIQLFTYLNFPWERSDACSEVSALDQSHLDDSRSCSVECKDLCLFEKLHHEG